MGRIKADGRRTHELPIVSADTSAALFELADEFVRIKPWETIGNADFINVVDENSGRSGWAVVLGHAGEVFGLALYQGLQGLSQLQTLLASDDGIPTMGFDYVASLDLLNFNWVPGPELGEIDRKVLKAAGRPTEGKKRYHQFQSYRPGYVAWALDEEEALFLTRGMQAALALKRILDRGNNPFVPDLVPSFKFTRHGKLELGLVKPGSWQAPELEPPSLAPAVSAKLRAMPHSGTWQGGHFFGHAQVLDKDRPYHFHVAAFVEDGGGYAFPPNAFAPSDSLAQALADCLVTAAEKEGVMPSVIEFSDARLVRALAPLLSGLGIKAAHRAELPAFDELADALRMHLVHNPPK